MQTAMDLENNELQNKYLQARELVVRFINGDPNVAKDALKWIEETIQETAARVIIQNNAPPAGLHKQIQRSSNITSISLYQYDEYPLVVGFKDGSNYAYDVRTVVYNLPDGTSETKTAQEIFELLAKEDDDVSGSVGHLFHALIRRNDNKSEPIRYKKVQ